MCQLTHSSAISRFSFVPSSLTNSFNVISAYTFLQRETSISRRVTSKPEMYVNTQLIQDSNWSPEIPKRSPRWRVVLKTESSIRWNFAWETNLNGSFEISATSIWGYHSVLRMDVLGVSNVTPNPSCSLNLVHCDRSRWFGCIEKDVATPIYWFSQIMKKKDELDGSRKIDHINCWKLFSEERQHSSNWQVAWPGCQKC